MDIEYEIISMVILPLLLIQEGQLLVTGKSMCRKHRLTAYGANLIQEKSVG